MLLHEGEVVGYLQPGRKAHLPPEAQGWWANAAGDLNDFQQALPPGWSLLDLDAPRAIAEPKDEAPTAPEGEGEAPEEIRRYYLLHNGEVVGVLDARFGEEGFLGLADEEALARWPERLQGLWQAKEGELGAFLQALEEEERRFNYLESPPDESPESLTAEFEVDREAIQRHWERGIRLRDQFLFVRALRELEIAAALCDKYAMIDLLAELCNEMGNLYIGFEDHQAAVEVLEEGLSYTPSDPVAKVRLLTNLSQALDLAGKRRQALEVAEAALTDLPEEIYDSLLAGVYAQAASLYNAEGDYAKAVRYYKLAAYLADHSGSVSEQEQAMFHNNLGMAYLDHGDADLAVEELKKAAKLQPGDPFYQENLARCFEALG